MESIEFLQIELEFIALQFPNVHIKYGYNEVIETHIVELLPLYEYKNNSDLDNAWIPLSLRFMKLFKHEEITFISSDSSLALNNVIFEFNAYSCTEQLIIGEIFSELTDQLLDYSFPTEIPDGKILGNSLGEIINAPVVELGEVNYDYTYSVAA